MGTGLKKWSPPNRSKRVVETAMSAIGREDVLLAKMVCLMRNTRTHQCFIIQNSREGYVSGFEWTIRSVLRNWSSHSGTTLSSAEKRLCFTLRFSTMASTTKSVLCTTDAASVLVEMFFSTFWTNSSPAWGERHRTDRSVCTVQGDFCTHTRTHRTSAVNDNSDWNLTSGLSANFFFTTLFRLPSIPLVDFFRMSSDMSTSTTECPVAAATWMRTTSRIRQNHEY